MSGWRDSRDKEILYKYDTEKENANIFQVFFFYCVRHFLFLLFLILSIVVDSSLSLEEK